MPRPRCQHQIEWTPPLSDRQLRLLLEFPQPHAKCRFAPSRRLFPRAGRRRPARQRFQPLARQVYRVHEWLPEYRDNADGRKGPALRGLLDGGDRLLQASILLPLAGCPACRRGSRQQSSQQQSPVPMQEPSSPTCLTESAATHCSVAVWRENAMHSVRGQQVVHIHGEKSCLPPTCIPGNHSSQRARATKRCGNISCGEERRPPFIVVTP